MPTLNDVQSRLNATEVARVVVPSTPAEAGDAIAEASTSGLAVCAAGSLHSMGGQQFARGGVSISSAGLSRVGPLDADARAVWVQAGATWPKIAAWLRERQRHIGSGGREPLAIIQKQTGADEMTLGGALSSNAHGRVLGRKPIVADIEAFRATLPSGERVTCSREENPHLFAAAIGGYGLFGFVDSIRLKLEARVLLVRRVREIAAGEAVDALSEQARLGASYGDFQYMTDEASDDFMRKGILSTYSPAGAVAGIPANQLGLSAEDWMRLYVLAHTDKARAYDEYASHYLRTDGQLYWSDEHQFSPYLPDAADALASALGWSAPRTLMISELYVQRSAFADFMEAARSALLETRANVVYGTVRLIDAERETVLRWAKRDYACVIFNLLVEHSPRGVERAKAQFRALIDCALERGGCYYLTYHRWATREQLERAYPEFRRFLALKARYDPQGVFTSDWHRHHLAMFGETPPRG